MFVCIWYLDGKVQANENELNTFFSVQTVKNVIEYYKHTKKINLSLGFLLTISLRDTGMHCTFGFISFVYGFVFPVAVVICVDALTSFAVFIRMNNGSLGSIGKYVSMWVCLFVCVFLYVCEKQLLSSGVTKHNENIPHNILIVSRR